MNDKKMTRELQDVAPSVDSSGWVPIRVDQAQINCPDCGAILAEGRTQCAECGQSVPAAMGFDEQNAGASLIVVEGSMAGQMFRLEFKVHVIGRGEEADLVVLDPEISRMHARFKRHENHYIIEDLRSANGTWINDARVEGKQLLLPGDRLRVGQTELIIRYSMALA
jgi:hypothetical protein